MQLKDAKETSKIEEIRDKLQDILDDEDETRDNTPESLQESDRYIASEEASEALESAIDHVAEAASCADVEEDDMVGANTKEAIKILSEIV